MRTPSRRLLAGIAAAAAAAALMIPSAAFAQGGPGNGHGNGGGRGGGVGGGRGNGGGGGPGEEATANNLSVPAIFVPGTASAGAPGLNFACGAPMDPAGIPQDGFTVPGYYYLQGVDKWQASCAEEPVDTLNVTANWGDNIAGGEAKLKTGSPIRVEMGLLDAAPPVMTGYDVVKLEPSELDRVAPYGTEAASGAENAAPAAKAAPYVNSDNVTEVRVWDAGATFKIYNTDTGAVVFDGAATAEINATGRVVYGYNLRVPTAGDYTIEFYAPTVTITTVNKGTVSEDGHTVSIPITVGTGGGGGGHGGP